MIFFTNLQFLNSRSVNAKFCGFLIIILLVVFVYGWSIFEPLSSDALMHVVDSNTIKNWQDALKRLLGFNLDLPKHEFRLDVFYRPIFNDFYISLLKKNFGINPFLWRVSTFLLHLLSGILAFILFTRMQLSFYASISGAFYILLSPALFFGIYELGLSFSQLLVFFGLSSLLTALNFAHSVKIVKKIFWGTITFATTFLVVFTKESAIFWPFVVICFICFASLLNSSKSSASNSTSDATYCIKEILTKNNLLLFVALISVSLIYLGLRYNKFGSFTSIAAGIEGDINAYDSMRKFYAYFMYMIGLPTDIFPNWFSVPINEIHGLELLSRFVIFLTIFTLFILLFLKNRIVIIFSFLAIIFCFVPIIKVTRNAPYYSDLMSIGFSFIVAYGFSLLNIYKEKSYSRLIIGFWSIFIISLIFQSIYTIQRYIYNPNMWLARSQGISRSVMTGLAAVSAMPKISKAIQIGDINDHEVAWSIHHGMPGSGMFANIGLSTSLFSASLDSVDDIENILFMDFDKNAGFKRLGIGTFPGFGKLSHSFISGPVVRKRLFSTHNSFLVTSEQVIGIDCKSVISNDPAQKLVLNFSLSDGSNFTRTLSKSYNSSSNPERFVAKIISPPASISFNVVESLGVDCSSGIFETYGSEQLNIDDFSFSVNVDPDFNDSQAWIGQMERYVDGGVVVGPGPNAANVLFYPFFVSDNGFYLIKAFVKSADPSIDHINLGRLQINWHSDNDAYISTSARIFTAGSNFNEEMFIARPPSNAKRGYLYVTPHTDKDKIVFKSINLMLKQR